MQKNIPKVTSRLKHNILCMPDEIREASGIGGGLTHGIRCVSLAISAENQGAMQLEVLRHIKARIDSENGSMTE